MSIEFLRNFLLGCLVANYCILLLWALVFLFARGWMFRIHTKWFNLSNEVFDSIHYAGLAAYKIVILVFNLVPFVILCFLARGR